MSTLMGKLRYNLARRKFRSDMTEIITLTEAHKSSHIKPGHKFYKMLMSRAIQSINGLQKAAEEAGITPPTQDDLTLSVPKLSILEALAEGKSSAKVTPVGATIGVVIVTAIFTTAIAGIHNLYVYLVTSSDVWNIARIHQALAK